MTESAYSFYGETGEIKVEKDFKNIVISRRSTRQFSDEAVSDETIQKILDMAEDDIRSLLGIPDYYGILNAVSLGMRKGPSEERIIQPKVHHVRY